MRTALDLLDRDYAFSQRGLLRDDAFVAAAKHRGLQLTNQRLERLHEVDLLHPLFTVRRDEAGLQQAAAAGEPFLWELANQSFTDRASLLLEAKEGRLSDGVEHPYAARANRESSVGEVTFDQHWHLYSPWQLLDVPELLVELSWIELIPEDRNADARRSRVAPRRNQIVALSALEAAVFPNLAGVLRGELGTEFGAYDDWRSSRRAAVELAWLGLDADDVEHLGLELIRTAHDQDPLRDWFPLVAAVAPRRREKLRGSALMAMERRQAGEVLLRAAAEARNESAAEQMERLEPGLRWRTPRLVRREDLESTLTSFGLSPHPSLILVVEGAIDRIAFQQVFGVLGVSDRPDFIQIVDRHGVDQPLSALINHVVVPRLGEVDRGGFIPVDRPLTRMMVVTDPEGPMTTQAQRDAAVRGWTEQVLGAVAAGPKRQAVADRLAADLFQIVTWNDTGDCFEFAHFTDEEIARAAARHDNRENSKSADDWSAILRSVRATQGSLNNLFKKAGVQKSRVVAELMPGLTARISAEQDTLWRDSSIPIVRATAAALAFASGLPRGGFGLRLAPQDDSGAEAEPA